MSCRAALRMRARPFQRAAARCRMQLQPHTGQAGSDEGDIDQKPNEQSAVSCHHRYDHEGFGAICLAWGSTSRRAAPAGYSLLMYTYMAC